MKILLKIRKMKSTQIIKYMPDGGIRKKQFDAYLLILGSETVMIRVDTALWLVENSIAELQEDQTELVNELLGKHKAKKLKEKIELTELEALRADLITELVRKADSTNKSEGNHEVLMTEYRQSLEELTFRAIKDLAKESGIEVKP